MKKLWIDGHYIEVTNEVYIAYTKGQRKMKYFEKDLKVEHVFKDKNGNITGVIPSREDSLERLMNDNSIQFYDVSKSVECSAQINDDVENLHIAMQELTTEELNIIKMLFYDEMTERDTAKILGISQAAVNKKKHRILKKLKKIIKN
ncbi:sigma-70 family RNA polymerase sigma factor [Ruminococcus sp.]|uniref:sigma-70 family RNA polymerase sigma factor n=1 Tax=Ruminococcus sp. TaxID=41978 RepID=UPI0026319A6C|nr:sigma-70 family RNA polymerase sigma factor [Ruminococcus sp.]MDD6990120.1 sigma-70 family RNA polymerase sigma factor [Ruminococcus sp.]MDY6202814.1 sigma-70 family RNA polymerase sigma factor [Ruminococcus sp.]